ncbi:Hypothetical protein SRAE_2000366900 [Strongyloides ratti]|uniref:Uncharacterized protein n=1 Tax=Strongyloides ratti TaxID=34506 RepID=A0A090LGV3_STRRB|nr:Hypothetical protein SRAE_2000366900 [Strongyloides ratti]CEF69017.1 Hypothetical protein SRAE_2000366900 [Strongyloides ratti]
MTFIFLFVGFLSIILPYIILCSTEKPKTNAPKILKKEEAQIKHDINNLKKVENNDNINVIDKPEIVEEKENNQNVLPKPFDMPSFVPSDTYKNQLKENDYEMIVIKG